VRTRIAQDPAPDRNDRLQVEGLVARVLLWGGLLSLALHRAVTPKRDARQPEVFVSLTEVFGGLATRPVDPLAVIALGLVLLLVTPVLGVALAIPGFLAVSDRRYAAIAAIVLTMLVLGTLLAGGVG
jgi:uncharacterized membrane protein